MSMSSIYLEYIALMGNLYLKRPESKNSKKKSVKNTTKQASHWETNFPSIEFIIIFKISHVSYLFADVDQDFYGERWVEFNFS